MAKRQRAIEEVLELRLHLSLPLRLHNGDRGCRVWLKVNSCCLHTKFACSCKAKDSRVTLFRLLLACLSLLLPVCFQLDLIINVFANVCKKAVIFLLLWKATLAGSALKTFNMLIGSNLFVGNLTQWENTRVNTRWLRWVVFFFLLSSSKWSCAC